MVNSLETDYLIVGAGAVGMAFADELVSRSRSVRIILVDRRPKPGGHWNDAYDFVALHQPAAYYGVNSQALGSGGEDLASKPEILSYYESVLDRLCATGRVSFYPQCNYEGDGRFRSTLNDAQVYQVTVHRKTVDATYSDVRIPATSKPPYEIAEGVCLVPINALALSRRAWTRYVVIGAGKTGLDALLFLQARGIEPERIHWIVPNDPWLLNREDTFPEAASRAFPRQLRCVRKAKNADEFYDLFVAGGWAFQLDEAVRPTRFRCSTVNRKELATIRRVLPQAVRLGRVLRIDPTSIVLERGNLPTGPDVLHIDCTAHGLLKRPPKKVFDGAQITLQPLAMCQQVFSAALTAMVELGPGDDGRKNARCKPVPHPELPEDYFDAIVTTLQNLLSWMPRYAWWLGRKRLSLAHHVSLLGSLRIFIASILWLPGFLNSVRRIQEQLEATKTEPGADGP